MPPVRLRHRTADHPASAIRRASRGLVGPGPDRLGQVDVGVRVAATPRAPSAAAPASGTPCRAVANSAVRRRGELAHHQPAAGPRHPRHLAQPRRVVDDVAQPEADGDRVEHAVGERQPRGVTGDLGHVAAPRPRPACRPRSRPPRTTRPDVASSTVDTAVPAARSSTLSPGPICSADAGGPPPGPVLPQREHGVGQVVAAGDAVEHRRDLVRILLQRRPAHDADATCECHGRREWVTRA